MKYSTLIKLGGTDVFTILSTNFTFINDEVGKVFNFKYGDREVLTIYSTLDETTALEIITNKATELELLCGTKWKVLYEELVTKDFAMGTITKNLTTSTETIDDTNSTNRLDKVSGYDSENLVTDGGADETKTGVKTATSEKSYTGSTSTQSEREQALISLTNTNFYDIMFVDILVGFCGYIV